MREREWELSYCPHCDHEIEDYSEIKKRYICLICGWSTDGIADAGTYTALCHHVETEHPPESACPPCGAPMRFCEFTPDGSPRWLCDNANCLHSISNFVRDDHEIETTEESPQMLCTEIGCTEPGFAYDKFFDDARFIEAGPIYCPQHASDHGYCAHCGQVADDSHMVVGRH